MTNHPGRKAGSGLPQSLPQALTQARQRAGLTQTAAAKLLGAGLRTWQQWEAGDRGIPSTALELWLITAVADGLLPASDDMAVAMDRPSILKRLHKPLNPM
jgi:DNA-binding XRE family transcriptional regulator